FDALAEAVFGEDPLGRAVVGSAQTVGSITLEKLRAFHERHYLPANIVIAAAGSVEHDELVAMAGALAGFQAAPAPSAATTSSPPDAGGRERPAPDESRARFVRKDTEQYHVCLGATGLARDDERRFALRVLEGVLGATSSSRLFQEVRER